MFRRLALNDGAVAAFCLGCTPSNGIKPPVVSTMRDDVAETQHERLSMALRFPITWAV